MSELMSDLDDITDGVLQPAPKASYRMIGVSPELWVAYQSLERAVRRWRRAYFLPELDAIDRAKGQGLDGAAKETP